MSSPRSGPLERKAPRPRAASDRPVYWVGPRLRVTYELTQTLGGNIFLRYLPPGAAAGVPGTFLTYGTYPLRDAFQVTKALGQEKGVVRMTLGGNGIGVYRSSFATRTRHAGGRLSSCRKDPVDHIRVEIGPAGPGHCSGLLVDGHLKELMASAQRSEDGSIEHGLDVDVVHLAVGEDDPHHVRL